MFNGMINPTFASIKFQKEINASATKSNAARKYDQHPTSFKEIRELKEGGAPKYIHQTSYKKTLENQQNTLSNVLQDHTFSTTRKNLIKVDKSIKKIVPCTLFKSPSHKAFEINPLLVRERPQQSSNYSHYCFKPTPVRQEENCAMKTPYLTKTNRSFIVEQGMKNASFLTEKPKYADKSEKGSISVSSKASFEDSFQLYGQDLSYDEDERSFQENVMSSLELQRDSCPSNRTVDLLKGEHENKNMKKSMHIYCSTNDSGKDNDYFLKQLDEKSLTSSISSNIGSAHFTEKFQHYKKQHHQLKKERVIRLEEFQLGMEIGSGKYGKVHIARHKGTGFICAIKSVSKKIIKQQNLQIPFMREVKIQMYLSHPNIVKLYGFFHDKQKIYLIMEYCSGNHLFKLIRQKKQFEEKEIIQILGNIFEAVSFIHCHGVIHRDLKPENIVIENGVYKLCDFGWAAYACGDNRTTFCGTPLYVCPEVLKGEQYNSKADIWGLGIITYELAFGRVPFSIINQTDLMKIIKDPVYFPVWGSTSQKLIPIVKLMLSKNPDERPSLNEILSSEAFRNFNENLRGSLKKELDYLF